MEKLYRHDLDDGTEVLLKRITVASRAELITAFCTRPARRTNRPARCSAYQRTLAKGEVDWPGEPQLKTETHIDGR